MLAEQTKNLQDVDFTSGEFKANPFGFYKRLRAEQPVFATSMRGRISVWLITRYDDIKDFLGDERFAKDNRNVDARTALEMPWIPEFLRSMNYNLLYTDGDDHTRLKNLVHKAFTPRRIQQIESRIEELAYESIAKAKGQGQFDVVEDYAMPVASTIIAEIMGVSAQDMDKFKGWLNHFLRSSDVSVWSIMKLIPIIWQIQRFIKEQLETRSKNPGNDLISALIEAEEEGDKLTRREAIAMVLILLIAGYETTVNLIGSGTLALLEHPAQLEELRAEPELMKTAVEEILRYTVPADATTERYAKEAITMHGVTIPVGGLTMASISSANYDETVFENPHTFDIHRNPNRHLSFGYGEHYCLGAPLARLEGIIALNILFQELPDVQLAFRKEALTYRSSAALRGLDSLPVQF